MNGKNLYLLVSTLIVIMVGWVKISGQSNSDLVTINLPGQVNFQKSNSKIDFNDYLSGVNSVIVITDEEFELLFDNDNEFFRDYYKLLNKYFNLIGIEHIAVTEKEKNWIETNIPFNETVKFKLTADNKNDYISYITVKFTSCNRDEFTFTIKTDYYVDDKWDVFLYSCMKKIYAHKIIFNPENSLTISKNKTKWSIKSLKNYFDNNEISKLEGIYEKYGYSNSGNVANRKIAVVKDQNNFDVIYLAGNNNYAEWTEGELKGTFKETSISDFYKVNWIMNDRSVNDEVYLTAKKLNILEFDFLSSGLNYKTEYLKMYPPASDGIAKLNDYISSGTGFLISDQGYVVTNHHVIKNSKLISVSFNDKDMKQNYDAKIIYDDKKNDLSILKIKPDAKLKRINSLTKIIDEEYPKGTKVFTLGYPLIETMGESIKLSDGIISSEYGYMSNPGMYQLTTPINPGNSGGPLFDEHGNLIGVINSKYTGTENVTYAIKAKTLINIVRKLKIPIVAKPKKNISKLNLAEQVNELEKIVCLIKSY